MRTPAIPPYATPQAPEDVCQQESCRLRDKSSMVYQSLPQCLGMARKDSRRLSEGLESADGAAAVSIRPPA